MSAPRPPGSQAQKPPLNVLVQVSSDRSATTVAKHDLKRYSKLLQLVGRRFSTRLPSKVSCRDAFRRLGESHSGALSQARRRKQALVKSDVYAWSKDRGFINGRLLSAL